MRTSAATVRVHPFLRDLGLTAATGFTVLLAAFILISLFGRLLGPVALAEYLLLRRVVSWLQGGAKLGMSTALSRHVAFTSHDEKEKRETYFLVALGVSVIAASGLALAFNGYRPFFTKLFFGHEQMQDLILPLTVMMFGMALYSSVYGYYRGLLSMRLASGLEFCSFVIVPLAALVALFKTQSVALIVTVMGGLMCVCAVIFGLPVAWRCARRAPARLRQSAGQMLRYGLPRVVGDFGLSGLLALGPIIALHYVPLGTVAYLLLGASLLTGLSAGAEALGLVLLPKASMMLAQGRGEELRTRVDYLVAAVLELSVFGALQLIVFSAVLIRLWVGPAFLGGTFVVQLVLLATPFFAFYLALHSVLDAASVTAYNTYNVCASLTAFLGLALLAVKLAPEKFLPESIAVAWVCGFASLAWTTARTLRKVLGLSICYRRVRVPLALAAALGAISFMIYRVYGSDWGILEPLLVMASSAGLFFACLRMLGSPWLAYAWKLVFRQVTVPELSPDRS